MEELSKNFFHFCFGRRTEIKEIIVVRSILFNEPTIVTSDLHSCGLRTFEMLNDYIDLGKFIVLSVGDMAGDGNVGSDADPTELYLFITNRSKNFYYVQGNHDLPSPLSISHNILNGAIVQTTIGNIGGINGIVSNKKKINRHSEKDFYNYLKILATNSSNKIKYLLTHEAPKLPDNTNTIGNDNFFKELTLKNRFSKLIHIYGHCHHPHYHYKINDIDFINADSRVIIIIPIDIDENTLINNPIENRYY